VRCFQRAGQPTWIGSITAGKGVRAESGLLKPILGTEVDLVKRLQHLGWYTGSSLVICLAAALCWQQPSMTATAHTTKPNPVQIRDKFHGAAGIGHTLTAQVEDRYRRLPLAFEPYDIHSTSYAQVKFAARGNGYAILLAPDETVFALGHGSRSATLHMQVKESNRAPKLVALDELPGKSNYLVGSNPSNWRINVPNFGKIAERDVYRGIDLVYYGNQRQLEYDFIVSPGGDPHEIRLGFKDAEKLSVDSQRGDLVIGLRNGEIRMHQPVAYQKLNGQKQAVAARYVVQSDRSVTFDVAEYDATRELVVDPTLAYSTYLGGSNIDGANAITVAPDATAFIAGGTFSMDFPTAHALQANHGGPDDFSRDAFVAKISADGSTLLYSTYLGGSHEDVANGIAVDAFGNAYVTGTTLSVDFPVTPGSFNTICGGDAKCGASWNPEGLVVSNAFVTKLNPAGSGIIYSGYLGEYENVRGQAIAVDNDQIAYVTGQTSVNFAPTVTITPPATGPPPFPISPSAFQGTFGGGSSDAFLTKISATGSSIAYSSYLGGSNEESGNGIAVDGNGIAYIAGLTYSTDFPVTGGVPQVTSGGAGDAFVSRINTRGSGAASLLYGTYLGGSGLDQGNGIAVDGTGNAYVTGGTASNSFVFTPSGVQTTNHGQGDAFVAKLTPAGALTYFTFLGGTQADSGAGIAVDTNGNAYVTGSTVSTDFPTTSLVFQNTYGGGNADAFVAKLNAAGSALLYSSYLGGSNTEIAGGIALDATGAAYAAGQTCSSDFPLSNPLQSSSSNCDAYISKVNALGGLAFSPAGIVFPNQSLGSTSGALSVTLTNTNSATPVAFTGVAIMGTNVGDFVQTNTCTAPLAPASQCKVSVTFHPGATGTRTASVAINDNAPGSPQIISLSGTGILQNPDFNIAAVSPSATVSAGQSATYNLALTAFGGFSQPVTLSCTGLPAGATCSISPNPANPSSTSTVKVNVSTALRATVIPASREFYPTAWHVHVWWRQLTLSLFIFISAIILMRLRRRPGTVVFGSAVALLLLCAACSGGTPAGQPAGTPAGAYQVNIVGTAGSISHTTAVTLQVN
jgi:hypothetical protein